MMERTVRGVLLAQQVQGDSPKGVAITTSAYLMWGFAPIFWKFLKGYPPFELLAHRIFWALLVALAIMLALGRLDKLKAALRNKKTRTALFWTTLIIAINWFTYMYAVLTDRILQTSLGYYINPLISIFLGMIFLGERMRPLQWTAVGLAFAGVAWMTLLGGGLPVLSIVIALSFGFYGLLRKKAEVDGLTALGVETLYLAGFCLAYIIYLEATGAGSFLPADIGLKLMFLSTGLITAVPLLLFGIGLRSISLRTLGFLQYSAPSIAFCIGVFLYDEPFGKAQLAAFGCIWLALVIYTAESLYRKRGR